MTTNSTDAPSAPCARYEPTTWPCCGGPRHPAMHHTCEIMRQWERLIAVNTGAPTAPPSKPKCETCIERPGRVRIPHPKGYAVAMWGPCPDCTKRDERGGV